MAELKTKANKASVDKFIRSIKDEQKLDDCTKLLMLMRKATKADPQMWGPTIVGFGNYHYKYATGREGDWFLTGFSPRKQNITIYIMPGFEEYDSLLKKLGKHSIGKSCLYIKKLADVDERILVELITKSVKKMKKANA